MKHIDDAYNCTVTLIVGIRLDVCEYKRAIRFRYAYKTVAVLSRRHALCGKSRCERAGSVCPSIFERWRLRNPRRTPVYGCTCVMLPCETKARASCLRLHGIIMYTGAEVGAKAELPTAFHLLVCWRFSACCLKIASLLFTQRSLRPSAIASPVGSSLVECAGCVTGHALDG